MFSSLEQLNQAPDADALAALVACCGSRAWASSLLRHRPYADIAALEDSADRTSQLLADADWLEAFRSHPRIGDRKNSSRKPPEAEEHEQTEESPHTSAWSAEEQAGTLQATIGTLEALKRANQEYEERFGYIFIVCATGKSSEEMLAICRERLSHAPQIELGIAANELRRIARIRLRKLTGTVN